jgi:hypothetical protein
MNLAGVQAYAASQIANNSALAALLANGQPITYSPFTADETARAAIDAALRTYGVCIEVGDVSFTGDPAKPQNRFTTVDAEFDVFVAESIKVAHTPSGLSLVENVARAVELRLDARTHSARCTRYDKMLSEHGYVLHILTFTMPAEITP